MTWDEIRAVFKTYGLMVTALNRVLAEHGDPPVSVETVYVWRSQGLSRMQRWPLALALTRAGRHTKAADLTPLCAVPVRGRGRRQG